MRVETIDAVNVDLYADTGASPTSFYDGTFISRQWTTSLDLSKEFDVGIPLTVAGVRGVPGRDVPDRAG